ncbi:hypothetical protein DFP72DRAFT_161378 [Ephemerocybe angulata]|uniref:C2H2-type domain-containing protein n=1 Tax=Ephemerocybe angulata TaxID=980116 RepID=A0A8H6MB92_9AGAR|nr:hypothetical protein DFP72DRAFT_161378 [Tulosesus angulatus]
MFTEYCCKDCSRVCNSDAGIASHCKAKHYNSEWTIRWFCEKCAKLFTNKNQSTQHLNSAEHQAMEGRLGAIDVPVNILYGCDDCERAFRTGQGLRSHCSAKNHRMGAVSTEPLYRWMCNPCNEKFVRESDYKKHCTSKQHKKPVRCTFPKCTRRFKSPSGLASHLESGFHGFSRHKVTRAVQLLQVIPQITVVPTVGPSFSAGRPVESGFGGQFEEVVNLLTEAVQHGGAGAAPTEPGPPLGPSEEAAATVVSAEASEVSTVAVTTTPTGSQSIGLDALQLALGPIPEAPRYVVNDFAHLGIPFTCPTCAKTFKKIISLTAHMNSPAHDADAFLCPGCDRRFPLVSSLIQHLESGSCELASKEEVFDRFLKMTDRFSRMLIA